MTRICEDLLANGFDLNQKDALEVFGRKGDWHTVDYADKVKSLEVWEIDPQHNEDLKKNLAMANIRNVDSIQYAGEPNNTARFDLIVIDNPQALFGPNNAYCEHFDVLGPAVQMLRPNSAIVINVNIRPYDYERHPEWRRRREEFYNKSDASSLDPKDLLDFYKDLFEGWGKTVVDARIYGRNEFLHYLLFRLWDNGDATEGKPGAGF